MNTASGRASDPCLTSPNLPAVRSPTTPGCPSGSWPGFFARGLPRESPRIPIGTDASWASPFSSRLATATGRIEFVFILPTSSSSPVALHPASRRRSYLRLSRPGPAPNEDFHLTDSMRSQAHWRAASCRPEMGSESETGARRFFPSLRTSQAQFRWAPSGTFHPDRSSTCQAHVPPA